MDEYENEYDKLDSMLNNLRDVLFNYVVTAGDLAERIENMDIEFGMREESFEYYHYLVRNEYLLRKHSAGNLLSETEEHCWHQLIDFLESLDLKEKNES